MLKKAAIIIGALFIIAGILGFIPFFTREGYLLGLFHVNVAHNVLHLVIGVIGIICGRACEGASRLYFRVFGIIYALVAVLGFFYGNQAIFGIIANNKGDNFLHLVAAILFLLLGFGCCKRCCGESSCHTKAKDSCSSDSCKGEK